MRRLAWEFSVFLSRWRNRARIAFAAPFLYKNWWDMFRAKGSSANTVLETRTGLKYSVRPKSTDLAVINEAVVLDPYLKPGYLRLQPNSVVVDVGANIGDFTMRAAKLCPQGHVYAVEPIAGNCERIQQHVELNQVANVTVFHLALGDHMGDIELHSAGSHSSAYWGDHASERVGLATLESLMQNNNIGTIDLLKMDCEGAEWDILPASASLLPKIKQLCLEYHNGKLTAGWLEQWLQQNGYTVQRTRGEWNGLLWAWRSKDS